MYDVRWSPSYFFQKGLPPPGFWNSFCTFSFTLPCSEEKGKILADKLENTFSL
jgi:hypothetical protein